MGGGRIIMKVYDPKTAIANRLQGQNFTINNLNDEMAMLEDIIRAGSTELKEYISESCSLHHDEYIANLDKTAKAVYDFYLPKSSSSLNVSIESIKQQIISQLNDE